MEELEQKLTIITEAEFAVAFSSGTAALHAAAWAAGLGPGDTVATSPLSFAASANCARYVGSDVRFLDIEEATYNLDPSLITSDIGGLVAVHYAGLPIDLRVLPVRPRVIIEDAAHAIGARTPTGPVGNCAHSDLCCFSFHPVKTVTTAEGGAVTTNDERLAERLRRFRHHGMTATPDAGGWAYDVAEVGYNYRLSDIHAALGSSQLDKLERFVTTRNNIAQQYRTKLADLAITLPPAAPPGFSHAYHLFAIRVEERRTVYDTLRACGVGVQVHYVPTYRLGAYSDAGGPAAFPVTESVYAGLLSLPIYPALTHTDQDDVVAALAAAV